MKTSSASSAQSKLCCLLKPIYICGSCSYSQCDPCNSVRVREAISSHFLSRYTRSGKLSMWDTCSVTGKAVICNNLEEPYLWKTKAKLCCLLNPSYICSSCGFRECYPCVNNLPGTHFKTGLNKKHWVEKCAVTGKAMKLQSKHSMYDTWIWEEVDE